MVKRQWQIIKVITSNVKLCTCADLRYVNILSTWKFPKLSFVGSWTYVSWIEKIVIFFSRKICSFYDAFYKVSTTSTNNLGKNLLFVDYFGNFWMLKIFHFEVVHARIILRSSVPFSPSAEFQIYLLIS